jgi:broad specificity phosphatase PhoE
MVPYGKDERGVAMSVELVCVRHGRTAWNAERRFQGRTDVPLDDEGRAQARSLAALLAADRFDAAVASDLARARETAEIILGGGPPPLELDGRLREMAFGAWEGLTWDEIVARYPEVEDHDPARPRFFTPDGGETFEQVCERVAPVLAEFAERLGPDGRGLVVAHAGVLHAIVKVLVAETETEALTVRFSPASATRFVGANGSYRIASLNETGPVVPYTPTSRPR